jgi:glycosyltransferase involved in cell wall biosynthesis
LRAADGDQGQAGRLIVIGPLPPPHHGVSVSTSLVLANPELRRRFAVEHLNTSDSRSLRNVGRWGLWNALLAISAVTRLILRLRGGRGLVYLPISQGLPGLARDTLFINLAALRGWKVAAHLRGSELGDVYRRQSLPIRHWLRFTSRRLDSMAVLGESLRTILDDLVPADRVAVVPNGTPDPGPPSDDPRRERTGIYLSNFRERKGTIQAMEAALIVVRKEPSARFIFVGDCPDPSLAQTIRGLADTAGRRIELRPAASSLEVRELLASASFLLFPPAGPEGQPRVVLEAMAAGLPVVSTDRGAIRETVGDQVAGYVLPDPVPSELADRMLRLLRDEPLRAEMSKAARARYLERFTQRTADRVLADWLAGVAANGRA